MCTGGDLDINRVSLGLQGKGIDEPLPLESSARAEAIWKVQDLMQRVSFFLKNLYGQSGHSV